MKFIKTRTIRTIVIGVIIICGIWLGFIAEAAIGLQREVNALSEARSIISSKPELLIKHVERINTYVASLHSRTYPLRVFLPLLGWVPEYGSMLRQGGTLLDMGNDLTYIVYNSLIVTQPVIAKTPADQLSASLHEAINHMEQTGIFVEMQTRLANVKTALASLDRTQFPTRINELLDLANQALTPVSTGIEFLPHLPALLGVDKPANYLIVIQNTDERRATGGFLSSVALVTVNAGQVSNIDFKDSYLENTHDPAVLQQILETYPLAPQPMQDYLYLPVVVFRDSNWEPDVTVSGAMMADRYERATGVRPDVIVLITPAVGIAVVDLIDPINLEDGTVVTADNLITLMRDSFSRPADVDLEVWYQNRKAIYNELVKAISIRFSSVVQNPNALLDLFGLFPQKQILMYSTNAELQAKFERADWAGKMLPPQGDYLMVVDSNVGFNKTNFLVDNEISYTVNLIDEPRAILTLTQRHRGTAKVSPCVQYQGYAYFQNLTYQMLADRCYYSYMRVYAPANSGHAGGSLTPIAGINMSDGRTRSGNIVTENSGNYSVFSWPILVPVGEIRTQQINYKLPETVIQNSIYRLDIQKQPGTGTIPLKITLFLPDSAKINAAPGIITYKGKAAIISTDLGVDRHIIVQLGK